MKWVIRFVIVALLAGAAFWAWKVFFPGPEKVIRKRLQELATVGSFGPNEAPLAKLSNANKLVSFFTSDAVIVVDLRGGFNHRLRGQDEMLQAAMGARNSLMSLSVEFIDITIRLGPDKKVAIVDLTAKARSSGDRDDMIQELRFSLRKIGGDWLINRVETVKTLSMSFGDLNTTRTTPALAFGA